MANKTKITFVVHSLNPGGAEKLALDMALELKKEFQLSVICLDEVGIWGKILRNKQVPVISLYREEGVDIYIPYLLSKYTKEFQTNIIHAHQTTPWFYSALSRLFNPKPYLLFEEHGRFYPEIKNKKKILFNKLLINKLTHKVVAVSNDIKNRLIEYEGVSEKKIQVIYNGIKIENIDTDHLKKECRKKLNLDEDDFVVGSVGRLDPIKNFPMLIKGIKIAKNQIPNLKCVIIGDGPEFSKLNKIIEDKQLEDIILLTGYKKDASRLVAAFDVFVLTSFSEGISMAILEAMSLSVPCIATKVGGNVELIENNLSGWLVESNDWKSLARVLIYAYNNRELLEKIGKNGQKQVKEKFLFKDMIENYKKIYRQLSNTN